MIAGREETPRGPADREPLPEHALRRLLAVAAGPVAGPDALPRLPARYRVRAELGRGGMGVVYEAHDVQLDRICAVKVIGPAAGADEEARRRFLREALAAARLRHPHIAAVYDATPDYISMQRIVGVPLDAIDPAERRLLVELVRDAARAVHHAHEQGIVHRDLKPSNLLVEGRHLYVVDFGLAKETSLDASHSLSGAVVGTPTFMPPEQALGQGRTVDARSDVYALGATLYRCLSGRPPFTAEDLPALLRAVVEDEPRPPGAGRDLDLVVLRCLRKEPAQRYQSARELALDLDRWLLGAPVLARRPSLGYRLRKHLQRRGALLRAAAVAALVAIGLTALVLGPIALRESAGRVAASEAVALSAHTSAVLQDAMFQTRLGDLARAHEVLDGGIARARAFLGRHDVARVHHLLSRLLRARGRTDEALAELQAAIAGDPSLEEARFERGLMVAARADLTAAERRQTLADLSIAVAAPALLTDVDRLFGRAERCRLEERLDEARSLLHEVLACDPAHVPARVALSWIAGRQGDDDLMRYYSVSAVEVQQGFGPVYFAREQQHLPTAMFGLEGALVDCAPELADAPVDTLPLVQRGLVQLRRGLRLLADGDRPRALAALDAAVHDHDAALRLVVDNRAGPPPPLPGTRNNLAVCRMEQQRLRAALGDGAAAGAAFRAAAAELELARAASPGWPEPCFNLGLLALRRSQLLRMLGRAEASDRAREEAVAALGDALARAGPGWRHAEACRERLSAAAVRAWR